MLKRRQKMAHVGYIVRDGGMPLPSYLKIHKAVSLERQQRTRLADWPMRANRLKSTASAAP